MAIIVTPTDPTHEAVAAEAIPARVFVTLRSADASGKVRVATNTEADAAGLLGFARKAASAERAVLLYRDGDVVPGFTGLTPGQEYFLDVSGVDTFANLSASQWTRSVGVARSATKLELRFGIVLQKSA